jgi:hypothetical protein
VQRKWTYVRQDRLERKGTCGPSAAYLSREQYTSPATARPTTSAESPTRWRSDPADAQIIARMSSVAPMTHTIAQP